MRKIWQKGGAYNSDGVLGFLETMTFKLNLRGLVEGSYMKKKEGWWGILKRRTNTVKHGGLKW